MYTLNVPPFVKNWPECDFVKPETRNEGHNIFKFS